MAKQVLGIIKLLIKKDENLTKLIKKNKHIKWSKKLTTKKDLEKLYLINKKASKKHLKKIIRATNTNSFKPYISLHNEKFVLNDKKNHF
jgi:predicted solute-binding protein